MNTLSLSPALRVNEILRDAPATAAVFARLHLDTCCGASRSLAEAAASIGMPVETLIAELQQAAGAR